jgi:uncharacterized protein (DUF1330 family)
MATRQKISQMTPKGADLEATDLLEVSVVTGTGYGTYSITGQEIINAASGGAIDLQQVTDNGATTTNPIEVTAGVNEHSTISGFSVTTENIPADTHATLNNTGSLALKTGDEESSLQNTNVINASVILEFPNKATGSYTIATTADLTSGTVTSVAALTLGTAGTDLASTVATGTTTPVITLNVPTASATNRGALSTTDWTTFNAKASYTPRVQTVASAATVTPTSANDIVTITAQAAALALANPTGTWDEGQSLIIRIKDNATARAITYGTDYRAIGVTLPTTTVLSKTTYLGIIYNSTDTKWDVVGVTTQA